jgi:hypothetical protein
MQAVSALYAALSYHFRLTYVWLTINLLTNLFIWWMASQHIPHSILHMRVCRVWCCRQNQMLNVKHVSGRANAQYIQNFPETDQCALLPS